MSSTTATHNLTKHWQELDARHHIHPFTETQALNKKGVRVIVKADGRLLWDKKKGGADRFPEPREILSQLPTG